MIREGTVEYGENKQCRAYCKPIKKWELAEGKWREPTEQEAGTAFSIVSYDTTFGKRKNEKEFEIEKKQMINNIKKWMNEVV